MLLYYIIKLIKFYYLSFFKLHYDKLVNIKIIIITIKIIKIKIYKLINHYALLDIASITSLNIYLTNIKLFVFDN